MSDPQRPSITLVQAEAILKELMTKIWLAGEGRLSVEVCVDEAIRIAEENPRMNFKVPEGWRDRFVTAAKKVLQIRKEMPIEVEVIDATPKEFEEELAKHPQIPMSVKIFKPEPQ
jgi:hypothetical protein